jgi:bacterioferritin-associated ferredoxin
MPPQGQAVYGRLRHFPSRDREGAVQIKRTVTFLQFVLRSGSAASHVDVVACFGKSLAEMRIVVSRMVKFMNLDDQICYCYHVSARKLVNFAARTRPRRPSQMTECLGAGTGCGWCIPFLKKIAESPESFVDQELTAEEYAAKRKDYIKTKQPKNEF